MRNKSEASFQCEILTIKRQPSFSSLAMALIGGQHYPSIQKYNGASSQAQDVVII